MRALVTGADGFVGRWLVRHLLEQGDDVWSAIRTSSSVVGDRVRTVDVRDAASVRDLVAWARPEAIYHLAAVSFGPDAQKSVETAVETTVHGTGAVLGAAAGLESPPVTLIPSSSEVYGVPDGRDPIDEHHAAAPVNAYGATKLAQEGVGLAYHNAASVPVVITRSFNHIGPGQRRDFVVASFASQLARLSVMGGGELRVGNVAAERDFTDVRDVVRAYRLLVTEGCTGRPINVASGRATPISRILDQLVARSGVAVRIEIDRDRIRAIDPPVIVGDARQLQKLTGWQPVIPLEQTLADVWDEASAVTPQ